MVFKFNITFPDKTYDLCEFEDRPSWATFLEQLKSHTALFGPAYCLYYRWPDDMRMRITSDIALRSLLDSTPERESSSWTLEVAAFWSPPSPSNEITRTRLPSGGPDDQELESDMNAQYRKLVEHGRTAEAPSIAARSENFLRQQIHYPIYNGRPDTGLNASPIQIFYAGFGKFVDDMELESSDELSTFLVSFKTDVRSFMDASAKDYPTEEHRVAAISPILSKMLGSSVSRGNCPRLEAGSRGTLLDGQYVVTVPDNPGLPEMIMQVKNSPGKGSTDPYVKVGLACRKAVVSESMDHIRDVSCFPVLLFSITGSDLLVSGFVFADYVIQQTLTAQELLEDNTAHSSRILRLAKIFWAARRFLEGVPQHYQQVMQTSPLRAPADARFPYFIDLKVQDHVYRLRYLKRILPCEANRNIFLARIIAVTAINIAREQCAPAALSKRDLVVVKFSTRYGKHGHELLAKARLAPRIHYHGTLPGGILVTVMDYVRGQTLSKAYQNSPLPTAVELEVRRAIQILHDNDIVFGDLRLPNIMYVEPSTPKVTARDISSASASASSSGNKETHQIMFVDFDWCAPAMVGRYPPTLNEEIPWAAGVASHAIMKKSHDLEMLANMFPTTRV